MTYLRPRPKSPRLDRGQERREFPKHRKWLRTKACVVPGCNGLPIVVAHVRSSGDGGVGLKPADWWAVPMCSGHHTDEPQAQHRIGESAFEKLHGIDLQKLAMQYAAQSPCPEVKAKAVEMGR